jgi:hypothetical protein
MFQRLIIFLLGVWSVVLIVSAIFIGFMETFGIFDTGVRDRIPAISLTLLSTLASYVLINGINVDKEQKALLREIEHLEEHLGSLQFHSGPEAGYMHLTKTIDRANTKILHCAVSSIMPRDNSGVDAKIYTEYEKAIDAAITKRKIKYEYIALDSDEQRKKRIEKYGNGKYPKFTGLILKSNQNLPPLFNFIIIDDEILTFVIPNNDVASENHIWASTRNKTLIDRFGRYFSDFRIYVSTQNAMQNSTPKN